jgi:predicted metal-binding protein
MPLILRREKPMVEWKELEEIFHKHGLEDFKKLDPRRIIVSQWVRMKCIFGCPEYGRTASCPPHVPPVDECRLFFQDYIAAAVFHFQKSVEKPEDRFPWTKTVNRKLLEVEREVFLLGYEKAFLLFLDSCNLCPECAPSRDACKLPHLARPTPEALAVDVYATVRRLDYPIQVLREYDQPMDRYAFLLIE